MSILNKFSEGEKSKICKFSLETAYEMLYRPYRANM
jgi:hypothetical protein